MSLIGFSHAGRDERERGNKLFSEKKYNEAIECYTAAISKSQNDHSSFANRALCYLKLGDWLKALDDCQLSIQFLPSYIKGHFYMGQAYIQLENYQAAVDSLQTAHRLAKEQKRNFGDDIAAALRMAKRKKWQVAEKADLEKESSLHRLLKQLLSERKDREISKAKVSTRGTGITATSQIEKLEQDCVEKIEELDSVFKIVDDKRRNRDIPDYLCGKISFELMKDPCITPSGITYERSDIEEHLNRVGHFDPVTRKPLTIDQLIPNLAMKEVVGAFVSENGWVEDY